MTDETLREMQALLPDVVGMRQVLHALHAAVVLALAMAMQGHHHDGGQEN